MINLLLGKVSQGDSGTAEKNHCLVQVEQTDYQKKQVEVKSSTSKTVLESRSATADMSIFISRVFEYCQVGVLSPLILSCYKTGTCWEAGKHASSSIWSSVSLWEKQSPLLFLSFPSSDDCLVGQMLSWTQRSTSARIALFYLPKLQMYPAL